MIEVSGEFYEPGTSRAYPARLALLPTGELRVSGAGFTHQHRLDDSHVSDRLGNLVRSIRFPDGGLFETPDNEAIDRYLADRGGHAIALGVHRLERAWLWAGAAVVAAVIASWLFIAVGLPLMASMVASTLPPEVDEQLGRDTLKFMDELMFEPSTLDEGRQAALQQKFSQLAGVADTGRTLVLEFREGGAVGANAFALPSGLVVMTDELVALAENDDELAAVLAHEIGHVDGRHSLRLLLQNSIAAVTFAVVLGDITSITGLAAALPAVLVQTKYSRAFETEADEYALALMTEVGIAPRHFSDILRRMSEDHGEGGAPDFLATHPATEKRIQRFEN